ncbi:hypothetical protein FACS1894219_03520 [Clostridia bacterium]|nr:hypothetical protein FACS1894219_03520 [Clostridia bacterium]
MPGDTKKVLPEETPQEDKRFSELIKSARYDEVSVADRVMAKIRSEKVTPEPLPKKRRFVPPFGLITAAAVIAVVFLASRGEIGGQFGQLKDSAVPDAKSVVSADELNKTATAADDMEYTADNGARLGSFGSAEADDGSAGVMYIADDTPPGADVTESVIPENGANEAQSVLPKTVSPSATIPESQSSLPASAKKAAAGDGETVDSAATAGIAKVQQFIDELSASAISSDEIGEFVEITENTDKALETLAQIGATAVNSEAGFYLLDTKQHVQFYEIFYAISEVTESGNYFGVIITTGM